MEVALNLVGNAGERNQFRDEVPSSGFDDYLAFLLDLLLLYYNFNERLLFIEYLYVVRLFVVFLIGCHSLLFFLVEL